MFAIVCVMLISSCGGGSGSGGSKLAKNDFLGDMPNIVYQKHLTDSIRNAEEKAALSKITGKSNSDMEKAMKIYEKFKTRKKTEDEQLKANVEKIKPELIGKDIPFEVEEGAGYEITYCKISDVESSSISVDFEVKITDVAVAGISNYGKPRIIVTVQDIDKDGKQIDANGAYYIDISGKENGATGKSKLLVSISKQNAKGYVNFANFKFIKTK
jgi:hypothetical protein